LVSFEEVNPIDAFRGVFRVRVVVDGLYKEDSSRVSCSQTDTVDLCVDVLWPNCAPPSSHPASDCSKPAFESFFIVAQSGCEHQYLRTVSLACHCEAWPELKMLERLAKLINGSADMIGPLGEPLFGRANLCFGPAQREEKVGTPVDATQEWMSAVKGAVGQEFQCRWSAGIAEPPIACVEFLQQGLAAGRSI
jgi:hypothetical protein